VKGIIILHQQVNVKVLLVFTQLLINHVKPISCILHHLNCFYQGNFKPILWTAYNKKSQKRLIITQN